MATTRNNGILNKHSFCLITGASKGLGRCLAVRFATKLPAGSVLVLVARSAELLKETRLLALGAGQVGLRVLAVPMDLSLQTEHELDVMLKQIFLDFEISAASFQQAIVVHNAASLGNVSKLVTDHNDWQTCREYFDLNLTAVIILNSIFFKYFPRSPSLQRVVLNISSICAVQPFKSWSLYCAGKAGRDMLFRTMALEEPEIRILNYAPGPLDTEMQQLARNETKDQELKQLFQEMHLDRKLLTCDESVDKLEIVLQKNTFLSGAHLDFYDL